MMERRFLLIALCLAVAVPAGAQTVAVEPAVLPALSVPLQGAIPADVLSPDPNAFVFADSINPKNNPGSVSIVATRGGKPVYRARNPKASTNHYGINIVWSATAPIARGDVVLARFAARAITARQESGEAEGMFFIRTKVKGAENSAVQTFSVGPDWTVINVPFVADRDFAAGDAQATMNFGQLEQTFEVTGLELLNFGKRIAQSALPVTQFTYAGREPGAAWRTAALARIETLRTAPLTVRVIDARGRAVPQAKVVATMTRSEFLWGTAVSAETLVGTGADADRYRRAVVDLFDMTVIDNGFKWPRWIQPAYRANAMKALDWLEAQGKPVKGHTLVWPAWKFSPPAIARDPSQHPRINELVTAHIKDITAATRGRLIGWDVINEPVHEKDYFKHMPREAVAEWFKLAAASDPKLKLTLNDYGMLNRSSSPLIIAELLEFSRMLRTNGARVDILGVQGHVGQTPRAPASVLSDLDLLAADGQQIQITEFDINSRDEALQGDYTRDFLIALYSHKAVSGFIQWGFWEKQHWKPAAAMFRADWSEKPNLKVWRDLVHGAWRTKLDATTDAAGTIADRGHLGTYRVTVEAGGKRAEVSGYRLVKGAPALVVRLK